MRAAHSALSIMTENRTRVYRLRTCTNKCTHKYVYVYVYVYAKEKIPLELIQTARMFPRLIFTYLSNIYAIYVPTIWRACDVGCCAAQKIAENPICTWLPNSYTVMLEIIITQICRHFGIYRTCHLSTVTVALGFVVANIDANSSIENYTQSAPPANPRIPT